MLNCKIRHATPSDAPFIAQIMAEAVGEDIMERSQQGILPEDTPLMNRLTEIAELEDTLYSWRNTRIAEDEEGNYLGGLIAYPGENYTEIRRHTFSMVQELISFDTETMDAEARDGEFYLDSLAVLPQYRGLGIGRKLLQDGIRDAKQMQRPAILACAPENTKARALYESLGFRHCGNLFIFGEDYLRMVVNHPATSDQP